jgi:acetylornithine deacetylase/succinyl-diaminopimelate desuccinylase-like protein
MAATVQAIDAYHQELRCRSHPLTGGASITVSRIQGGEQDNLVPDVCTALVDRRLIPGETNEAALAELQALFESLHRERPGYKVTIDHLVPTTGGPAEMSPDAPVVALLQQCIKDVTGRPPVLTGLGGACDMVHLVNARVPAVVFGPGDPGWAHKPDERIMVEELVQGARTYLLVALRYLACENCD